MMSKIVKMRILLLFVEPSLRHAYSYFFLALVCYHYSLNWPLGPRDVPHRLDDPVSLVAPPLSLMSKLLVFLERKLNLLT